MTESGDRQSTGGTDAESPHLWTVMAGVLGASLWAQIFWFPLATEILSEAPAATYLGLYLLPLLVLGAAVTVRQPAAYLFFVPVAMLAGMLPLPGRDVDGLLEPWRALAAGATLVCFLVAGIFAGDRAERAGEELDDREPSATVSGLYRFYFAVRLAVLALLFVVLVLTPLFDGQLLEQLASNHAENRRVARAFLLLFGFFTWSVLAYMMFFSPAANVEYEIRGLREEIDAFVRSARGIRWRLVAWGGAALVVVGAVVIRPDLVF